MIYIDVTYMEKMERLQAEIETCRTRFSKSGSVYKLMMTRSNHIEVTFWIIFMGFAMAFGDQHSGSMLQTHFNTL